MDDLPPILNISICLKIQPNEGPVFFKVDGTRFGQTRTIKLLTGSKYKIEVVLKPGKAEATNMNIGGVIFPLELQAQEGDQEVGDKMVYHGQYDTEGVPHTKSGDRQPIQVSIEFPKAGQFETVWQVKFYNYYKREHCQFGNKFSDIEYECKPNETRTLMWINKEVFN
ncbi:CB1 cannabinoid receptor-interacting protein 1a [Gadus morhua]|uniref:Cannabinoid receptor interacting protein 1a n=1 Tax=Gadus morhua TaxID=8049 RepID=A0A8C4Z4K4_GADMO|nr:CB1 cannabinoid receptor-interacting protein 1 [Gadus morhua]